MSRTGVSILGSTGSIGRNTLRVIEALGEERFRVVALGAGRNIETLAGQVARHLPELVSVETEAAARELRGQLFKHNVDLPRIVIGEKGLIEVATHERANCVVSATVGAVGFVPTLRALEAGKRVALANKETLVMAGELMTRAAHESGAELLPVDSEHNALHQCLRGEQRTEVRRIILTASGGPFRTKDKAQMRDATVSEALRHPTWSMGAKITIDSATLMNKGLEVIEAHWLFGFEADQIDIVVHPESVIHALVEFADGSVKAQLAEPDMRLPIQYALLWDRAPSAAARLDWSRVRALRFEGAPDEQRYPCLAAVLDIARSGDLAAMIGLSAADEVAVARFLRGEVRFDEIASYLRRGAALGSAQRAPASPDLGEILGVDRAVRTALEAAPALA